MRFINDEYPINIEYIDRDIAVTISLSENYANAILNSVENNKMRNKNKISISYVNDILLPTKM